MTHTPPQPHSALNSRTPCQGQLQRSSRHPASHCGTRNTLARGNARRHLRALTLTVAAFAASGALSISTAVFLPGAGIPTAQAAAKVISGVPAPSLDPALIDPNRSVALTVELTADNPFDEVRPGELPPGALSGYQVHATRVPGYDVTQAADRERARALTVTTALRAAQGESPVSASTDDNGRAVLNLKPGVWVVEFTSPSGDAGHRHQKLQPFVIMLPTAAGSTANPHWDYAPIVRAKQAPEEPTPVPVPPLVPFPVPVPVPPGTSTFPPNPTPPAENQPPSITGTTTPGGNDGTTQPDPQQTNRPGGLAFTGASVLRLLLAAACFIAAGLVFFFLGRRRRAEEH